MMTIHDDDHREVVHYCCHCYYQYYPSKEKMEAEVVALVVVGVMVRKRHDGDK